MHGLMSYRRFERARSLRSDRAGRTLATELGSSSVAPCLSPRTPYILAPRMAGNMKWVRYGLRYGLREIASKGRREWMD
ncbi:hypothetical protein F2Q69_00021415 [Brassica cretica]|uniref:Uncharacterized protein n=1 Tax=Brassica cretica TaxID=69181 RepID=A0A8S9QPJ1_BRACR|nr:hypothetical protein F2Q69_00021415 [Brassica cretica]